VNRTIIRAVGGAVTMAALAFGGAAPAVAATTKPKHATKKHARRHNTNSSAVRQLRKPPHTGATAHVCLERGAGRELRR